MSGRCVRRIVKNLCLGIEVAKAEDEEFCVIYTVQFGSESLYFGVYGLSGSVGRAVVKEVDYFIGVFVKGCRNGIERFEA